MPRSRRTLLSSLAVAGVVLAGCVSRSSPSSPDDHGAEETTNDPFWTTTPGSPTDEQRGPVRGAAGPISVERTIEDDVEYLSESDEVRYVAAYRHVGTPGEGPPTRRPVYDTMPFERWGRTECASVGAEHVRGDLVEEFGRNGAPGAGITSRFGDLAIVVILSTMLNRDGEVIDEPSVAFDEVVAVTPGSVDATVWLADREHRESVPVWVQEQTLRQE